MGHMGIINESLAEITRHGYLVLFTWVAVGQLGVPIPGMPILIAAGVLSASGELSLGRALLLGILGCLIGDTIWYVIGRCWATKLVHGFGKISSNQQACVYRGSDLVSQHNGFILLIGKYLPGINIVVVLLSAESTGLASFLLYDFLASAVYVGGYLTLGRAIGSHVDSLSLMTRSVRAVLASVPLLVALAFVFGCWLRR